MNAPSIAQIFDLTGKGAIVTGAAGGIGEAIACRLAEAGAKVMVVGHKNIEGAYRTAERIKAMGGTVQVVQADVSVQTDADKIARTTASSFGSVDILVNNAGIFSIMPALQATEEIWDRSLNINLKGMFFCARSAAREMIKAGNGGKIINIATVGALKPTANVAHYFASKAGVISLTQSLALELAPHRITVNVIAPGIVRSQMGEDIVSGYSKVYGSRPDEIENLLLQRTPLGRWGEPDDIAKMVLCLAGAAADFMTGSIVVVDGGYLLS